MVARLLRDAVLMLGVLPAQALAQPIVSITLPDKACRNELFTPANNSSPGLFKWEFCYAGINQLPVFQSSTLIGVAAGPDGIVLKKENGNWYGFVASTNSNGLVRLDYGSDLSQNPAVVNLGNPGGLLLRPRDVDFINHQGNWFALVVNFDAGSGTARIVRLDFGASLLNTPVAVDLGSFSGRLTQPFSVKWKTDSGKLLALIGDRSQRKILLVNFQSNPTVVPAGSAFFIEAFLPAPGFFRDFDVIKWGAHWYGVAVSENGAIQKLRFTDMLFTIPDVSIITNDLPAISSPSNVVFLRDIDSYAALITEYTGNLVRLDFGTNPSSFLPTYQNLGNGGVLANNQGLAAVKTGNRWIAYAMNTATSRLNRVVFQGACDASVADSESSNPVVSYASAGVKKILLEVTDASGEADYQINSILIKGDPSPDFTFAYNCTGQATAFSDASVADGSLVAWSWNFGDPISGSTFSAQQNPLHSFSSAATFLVELEVTDDCLVTASITKSVAVQDATLIDLTILAPGVVCSFQDVAFSPQSSSGSAAIRETEWNFGDGTTSLQMNPVHRYTQHGLMIAELEAVVTECRKIAQAAIQVNEGNNNSFTSNGICELNGTTFTQASIGLPVTDWLWTFGDGGTSTQPDPTHTFNAGSYLVAFQTTNSVGCINSVTLPVTIYSKPQTDFTVALPPFSCSGSPTQFTDLTPNPFDSNIASWLWNFDDGASSSTLKNPQHVYATAGTYQISLTATTNFGCAASVTKPATILPSPVVDFTYSPPCRGIPVTFTDTTPGINQLWLWQIESSFYSVQNPVHSFTTSGTRTVMLAVTGANGCVGVVSKQVVVPVQLVPDFITNKTCVNQLTQFTDNTNDFADPVTSWQWTFGALGNGSGNPAQFTFPSVGNVTVNLTVVTQTGCSYSRAKNVNISAAPVAGFTASPMVGEAPLPVTFTNTSTGATAYQWQFGDPVNSTSVQPSPQFIYDELGQYTVQLTAFNALNCSHQATRTIYVVVPVIDVEVSLLELLTNQAAVVPAVTLVNRSNVPLQNPVIRFDISGSAAIHEVVPVTLPSNSSYRHLAGFSIPLREGMDYVCAEILLDDINPEDNRICSAVNALFLVLEPFPNPVLNKEPITVGWVAVNEGSTDIRLQTSSGNEVFSSTVISNTGYNSLELFTDTLKPGLYVLRIGSGSAVKSYRLVVAE